MDVKTNQQGICRLFLMAVLFVAGSHFALAQVQASISGRIEDSSGAAIPGAAAIVTNLETGATRTMTTDEAGNYRALSLPVGLYEVRAEKTGFKALVQTGINLVVGQQAVVNLRLEVGEVQQEVTVSGESLLVNTTTASISGLVGEQQVKDLPLNGRSFDLLITLNPGVINYTSMKLGASSGHAAGGYFSVAGRRPLENLFLLNGVEYTGASLIGLTPGGVSGQLLGIDAVREFNVVSSAYSAEYGKRAGAQVSIATQSGTNRLHGNLFEFLRNNKLDARNFFDQGSVPGFARNQFGGSAGGPIRKDKTFVFGNYEGFRQRLGLSVVTFVPDMNARKGLLPCVSNGVPACGSDVPVGTPTVVPGLNPAMLPFTTLWPEPNGPNLGQGIALTYSNPKQSIREDFGTVRIDQTVSSKDSLSGVYTVDDGFNLTPAADPLFGPISTLRSQVASLQDTHIFSSQVINTLTAGFSRGASSFLVAPLFGSFPPSLSFVTGKPPGSLIISGGLTGTTASAITPAGGSSSPDVHFRRSLFTYSDGLQVIKGNHQISAGVWFQRIRSNESATARVWGAANFSNLQSFLQGTVGTFTIAPISTPMGWRSLEGAWYLQDAIQLRPNLTLRVGLRHEFTNGWNEVHGRATNSLFDQNGVFVTEPKVGNSALTENNAKWLLGPRVGLVWDPFGKGKTSIRAGWGTYYDLFDSSAFALDQLPPYNGAASFSNIPLFSITPVNPALPVPPPCGPGAPAPCTTFIPKGIQSSFKTPAAQSWNFTVEQQLATNMALRVAYVGSFAVHQFIFLDPNQVHSQICSNPAGCISGGVGSARGAVPQGAEYIPVRPRPNPYLAGSVLFWLSEGNASYNALQVEVTRRLSHGLQFRGNYTWSKNLDNLSSVAGSQSQNEAQSILNMNDLHRDWGVSAMNATHQASGNFSYELPLGHGKSWLSGVSGTANKLIGGWQMNGIVTLVSGFPFTPQLGSNRSGNGDGSAPDRPSMNPAFTGPTIIGSPNRWFNRDAFILPTVGTFGNAGRAVLRGPGMVGMDFSTFKNIQFSERIGLQFRVEVFNIINRANFGTPNPILYTGTTPSPSAGVISSTETTSRQIQFGLKLIF